MNHESAMGFFSPHISHPIVHTDACHAALYHPSHRSYYYYHNRLCNCCPANYSYSYYKSLIWLLNRRNSTTS